MNKDPGAEERFKEINEAYSALSDPELRKRYDRFGEDFRRVPEDWEQRVGAGVGGGAGPVGVPHDLDHEARRRRGFGGGGFEGIDIEDLLGGMFGGRGRGRVPAWRERIRRPSCRSPWRRRTAAGARRSPSTARTARAATRSRSRRRQRRPADQAGRRGRAGPRRRPAGDLYLVVRLLPHPLFRVHGRNIHVDLKLAPWEAALGASVPVATPGGETKVTVPPGSSSGRRLRLRGQACRTRPGIRATCSPRSRSWCRPLSERERELFSELATSSTFDPRRATTDDGGGRR